MSGEVARVTADERSIQLNKRRGDLCHFMDCRRSLCLFFSLMMVLLMPLFPAGASAGPVHSPGTPVKQAEKKKPPAPQPDEKSPVPYKPELIPIKEAPPIELPMPPEIVPDLPRRPLSAAEAAQIALVYQARIKQAKSAVTAAIGRTEQTQAPGNTTVTLSTSYTGTISTGSTTTTSGGSGNIGAVSGSQGTSGSPTLVSVPGYQLNLTVRQLLFDFNHTRDQVRQSREEERMALAGLTIEQADTVFNVKSAFYDYAAASRLVNVYDSLMKSQQQHLNLAEERFNAGVGLPSDVVRAQAALASAVYDLARVRNTAQISCVKLATLMGIDPRTPMEASADPEPPILHDSMDALFEKALTTRPEMLQAMALVKAQQYSLSAAFSNDAPGLYGTTGYVSRGSNFPPRNDYFNTSLSLQWSIFDGGLTRGMVTEAKANLDSAMAQLELVRQSVISDVAQAYVNLCTAEQNLITADHEVASAQESLRLIEGRYKVGLGTFLEVLDAQNALLTAKVNRINARSSVDQAYAALARATGQGVPAMQ